MGKEPGIPDQHNLYYYLNFSQCAYQDPKESLEQPGFLPAVAVVDEVSVEVFVELVTPEVVDASVVGYGAATDLLVREVSPETKMF